VTRRPGGSLVTYRGDHVRSGAWAEGKKSGRHAPLSEDQRTEVLVALEAGETVSALARRYETSRQTILRAKAAT
jgi:putative DNA-invertase from lambdoid prophage Rac